MKNYRSVLKPFMFSLLFVLGAVALAQAAKREFYEIKIYTISSAAQEQGLDAYLKDAYLPAMHRQGIKTVGVFKPRPGTDDAGKKVYVFTPLKSQSHILDITKKLAADAAYQSAGTAYINARFDNKPYDRFESIVLHAFSEAPQMMLPNLSGPKKDRVYELRSYEGPTEKYYLNKVKMFNEGGEVKLFKRLNFNAVFYGEVITGSHMPNLMYMTTFENQADRDAHWKAFTESPEWAVLKADEQYKNNTSKNTQYFLYPTEYSDI
ncbi:NIPSNAP family protein [Persicitalea jodogahamensis]|uniref:NIPSNAP domain-containing protein n=1 Tax=Persicitalea jodogahamensis TaxID=402147 RepID=A0A8J3D1E0_9BACT|nr:NIPSNAP family protein [Persicitalea jodogahamensis]GHB54683.1 hypothetical protein GCM10007390_04720 [Persicitalea jodogahamensis]